MMDFLTHAWTRELGWILLQILVVIGPLLIAVAYLTLAERRVIGFMQLRRGPNVVGPFGMFQPFADALKLMAKETILPAGANKVVFLLAPMLTFILSLVAWAVIPFDEGLVIAHGEGRARRYFGVESPNDASAQTNNSDVFPAFIPVSADSQDILSYINLPLEARKPVGYQLDFLNSYQPNKTWY